MEKGDIRNNPELRDPYDILGVPKTASQLEIKHAWKDEVNKTHPDRFFGKEEKLQKMADQRFRAVQWAYDVLSDPEVKRAYDHFGFQGGPKQVSEGFGDFFSGRFV